MARIVYPETFDGQFKLLKLIKQKHDNDLPNSKLTPYLTKHGIVLADLVNAGNNAQAQDTLAALLQKQAENLSELRDHTFSDIMLVLRKSVQFLKALFSPAVHDLGDWGITVDGTKRIVYPSDFDSRSALVTTFIAKHDSFTPPNSPLQPFLDNNDIDLAGVDTRNDEAAVFQADFKQAELDAETATNNRNVLWNPVLEHIHGMCEFLMKLFPTLPKELGKYGIVVDDSPRKPKLRKTTILPTEQKTINGIVIGGTLTNTGETTLHLYKGKTTLGTPIIINPGLKHGMIKGFSTITVVNPDTIKTAKLTVLVSNQ